MSQYNNANVDETALAESLEGIPEIGHYFEVIYKTDFGLPKSITLRLFPAVRIIFRSPLYTIARCYIGREITTEKQHDAISTPYVNGDLIDYERVYPYVSQEEKNAVREAMLNNGD